MAFDYSKLRGKIREIFGTQERFANAMGLGNVTLSHKLNNKTYWTQPEINLACKLLNINDFEVTAYFFTPLVQETELRKNA